MTNDVGRTGATVLTVALLLGGCSEGAGTGTAVTQSPGSTSSGSSGPGAAAATVAFEIAAEGGPAESAVRVLHARLAALGLNPGDPAVAGRTVTFSVARAPSAEEKTAVARRGHVTFRPVAEEVTPPGPEPTPAVDCADPAARGRHGMMYGGPDDDGQRIVACDVDGTAKYVLAPVAMSGREVKTAEAKEVPGASGTQWVVALAMRSAADWAQLTESLVGQQVAIVLDGVVQSAPAVNEKIPDGKAEISGSFTEASARQLAAVLRSGALPVDVSVR